MDAVAETGERIRDRIRLAGPLARPPGDQRQAAREDDAAHDGHPDHARVDAEGGALLHRLKAHQRDRQNHGEQSGGASFLETSLQRHQTFSTSGRPKRPVGRKISTSTRMAKAATSLYSVVK